MSKILSVGLSCLDYVSYVKEYPTEDTDQHCREQFWTTGGNATNNCKVLVQLGCTDCVLFATFGDDWASRLAIDQLRSDRVDVSKCVMHENVGLPVSVVIVNEQNGSRTIVHHKKGLPEPSADEFKATFNDFSEFGWIHFEGRNVSNVRAMIQHVLTWRSMKNSRRPLVSVEMEKMRPELKELGEGVDFVFVGKDFAQHMGFTDMVSTVEQLASKFFSNCSIFSAWGERGACALSKDKKLFQCAAVAPDRVVDTLGAGDTFFASCIYKLSTDENELETALKYACSVAGAKCCVRGFSTLRAFLTEHKLL